MENRERDKVSDVNRNSSSNIEQKKSDSSADFGKKIDKSENLGNEPSRGSGSSGMQGDSKSGDSEKGESGVQYRGGIRESYLLTTTAQEYFRKRGFKVIDRDEVHPQLLGSAEFQGACPDSAVCMRLVMLA